MLNWLIRNRLDAFGRKYGYDVGYMRELLETDRKAFMAVAKVAAMGNYRRDIPKDVYWAAKILGAVAEDCGPCTQLGVAMALEDGASARMLSDVLAGRDASLSEDVRLGVTFARQTLVHDPEADVSREQIVKRWGQRALVSLSFALIATRIYPALKYALGHGKACKRVEVAGEQVVVARGAV